MTFPPFPLEHESDSRTKIPWPRVRCQAGAISPIVAGLLLAPILLVGLVLLVAGVVADYAALLSGGWITVTIGVVWLVGFPAFVVWADRRGLLR